MCRVRSMRGIAPYSRWSVLLKSDHVLCTVISLFTPLSLSLSILPLPPPPFHPSLSSFPSSSPPSLSLLPSLPSFLPSFPLFLLPSLPFPLLSFLHSFSLFLFYLPSPLSYDPPVPPFTSSSFSLLAPSLLRTGLIWRSLAYCRTHCPQSFPSIMLSFKATNALYVPHTNSSSKLTCIRVYSHFVCQFLIRQLPNSSTPTLSIFIWSVLTKSNRWSENKHINTAYTQIGNWKSLPMTSCFLTCNFVWAHLGKCLSSDSANSAFIGCSWTCIFTPHK